MRPLSIQPLVKLNILNRLRSYLVYTVVGEMYENTKMLLGIIIIRKENIAFLLEWSHLYDNIVMAVTVCLIYERPIDGMHQGVH